MTTPTVTSSTDSQMHNNIMAVGSRDRPPMIAAGRYLQWRSGFLRYIDTRPNGDALRKCILSGPYKPTLFLVIFVAATDDSPAIPEHITSRFVTIVKQQHKLDEVSYHKLFDIMKQYQKEINELRAERLARNANPLELVDTAQANQDPYYQTSKSHKPYEPSSKPSILTRSHTTTRYKGKEIAKPITPPSESASEEDDDPEQAQRDKDMQKSLALIAKYFKKIYKPTNNNLRTSSNSRNKNVDTTPRYKNDNQSGQFGNQRTMNVTGARENKAKKVKDSACHKEKMLLCKQAEKCVPLQAEQYDWLANTDEKLNEQELEAHYSYMAKIQVVPTADTCTDSEPLEQVQNDTGYNVFANDLQHSEQSESVKSDDERVALANLKLDVDENKKIQKQLKKANTTLAQELKECKTILAKTSKTLGESNGVRDSCFVALQNKQTEFKKYKAFNDRTVDYENLERKLNETLGQLAQNDIEIKEGLKTKASEILVVKEKHDELIKQSLLTKSHYKGLVKQKTKVIKDLKLKKEQDIHKMLSMEKQLKFLNKIDYKRSQLIKTMHMMAPKVPTYNGSPTFANPRYLKHAQSEIPYLYQFRAITAQDIEIRIQTCLMPLAIKTLNDSFIFVHELKQEMHADLKYVESLKKEIDELESDKAEFSNMYDMILDLQGNNLLIDNRGPDLYTICLQESTSSTPLCLMAKASPTQAWLWHRRLSHLNFDYINPLSMKDVVIGLPNLKLVKDQLCSSCEVSKAKRILFKSKAVPSSKGRLNLLHMDVCGPMRVASINGKKYILIWDKMKEKGDLCILVGYSTQSKGYRINNKRKRLIVESIHIRFDEIKEVSETFVANVTSGLVPQRQKASDCDNFDLVPQLQNVSSSADAHVPLQQELDLLFGPMYDEFFTVANIQPTSAPSTLTFVHAEENNDNHEEEEHFQNDEFTNPFCARVQEAVESFSHNIGNSNVPTFNQLQASEYRWTKDHPLDQVCRNPSMPVQTRRQFVTDPEMCMFALTVSTAEPKNIKEAMADSSWIEAMQEELYQFDKLQVWELVDKPFDKSVIRLKWLWKNKKDEDQTIIRNKARLVAKGRFEMSLMGEMKFFLGLQIHQSPRGIFINQAKYALEILHKHGMEKGQSIDTPMAKKPKLDADLSGNPVDQTDYRSKIESLMYLTSSRLDIVQAVCFCARYQSRPTEKHLKEVKRIFRYLRGTVIMGIWYPKGSSFGLTAFSDADHAGCIDTRKNTSGGIQFLGDKTEYQLVDMFTKALPEDRFKYFVRRIGMRCLTPVELEVLAKESA
nr:ribonuclease H-like domain-containing protein [Tanacetum cinerariifolium]